MKKTSNMTWFSQASRTQVLHDIWQDGKNAMSRYKDILATHIRPGMSLLHAGCGWDKNRVTQPYRDICDIVGVDLDPRVADLFHSDFHLASLSELPFPDNRFDVVVSEWVFEHVEDPAFAFRELSRVLKRAGRFVVLTPNFYSYKTLAAWVTPYRFHLWMGQVRYGPGHEADMYPTYYRCNTINRIRKLAKVHGFHIVANEYINNGPTWFEKFPVLFELFHFFHLLINRSAWAQQLRCSLIVVMEKG